MTAPVDANVFGGTQVPAAYSAYILAAAHRWNISPAILAAQIDTESGFDPNARSNAGAEGIAQFLPETAKDIGVDPWSPSQAIDGMAQLDAAYVKRFGSMDKALAAYNAGPGAVDKYGGIPPYAETENYVKTIFGKAGVDGAATIATASLSDPFGPTTALLDTLKSPDFWRRIGTGALGVFVVFGAVYMMWEKEGGKIVRNIAGNVP